MILNYSLSELTDVAQKVIKNSKNNVLLFYGEMGVGKTTFVKYSIKQFQKNNTLRYENKEEPIEDGLYDKLLGLLDPEKRMLHGRKTKRKRENNKRKTRKERK